MSENPRGPRPSRSSSGEKRTGRNSEGNYRSSERKRSSYTGKPGVKHRKEGSNPGPDSRERRTDRASDKNAFKPGQRTGEYRGSRDKRFGDDRFRSPQKTGRAIFNSENSAAFEDKPEGSKNARTTPGFKKENKFSGKKDRENSFERNPAYSDRRRDSRKDNDFKPANKYPRREEGERASDRKPGYSDRGRTPRRDSGFKPANKYPRREAGESSTGRKPAYSDRGRNSRKDSGFKPANKYPRREEGESSSERKPGFSDRSRNPRRDSDFRPATKFPGRNESENSSERKPGYSDKRRTSRTDSNFRPANKFSRTESKDFFSKKLRSNTTEQDNSYDKKPKTVDANKEIRLNKYIAEHGLCSRREADVFIASGVVSVNDVVVTKLGTKVLPGDEIKFNGERLREERKVYLLLNKPKDYVTTMEDPNAKRTVMELIQGACKERIYPVGRLDRNTTGVLLFTNDGDLTRKLTHPSFHKKKVYHVFLNKVLKPGDMSAILNGVELEEGMMNADEISYVDEADKTQVGVEIHTGQNRIVRRLFEQLGYTIKKLDRVYFAGLTKKGLQRGEWRMLSDKEIRMLKTGAYE